MESHHGLAIEFHNGDWNDSSNLLHHQDSPELIFQRICAFQKQLKADYEELSKHAKERFFMTDVVMWLKKFS